MIERPYYIRRIATAIERAPIVALLGPRQSGKTTLARRVTRDQQATFFDLESVPDQRRLQNPELALGAREGLIVLDEIQRQPDLFAALRVLVDRSRNKARFLILGSASPTLIRSAAETLAGRVEFIELVGFDLSEVSSAVWDTLWVRGGFPRSFLAESMDDSAAWRENFVRTFLERDVPQLGINIPAVAMRRFWTMLAHYHGQTWNASEIARSLGVSDKTVRAYLDILTGTYLVRQLQPWYENLGKRQVKAPKIYIRDTGLLHALLTIPDKHALLGHPKVGASWEGFALEQALHAVRPVQAYYWATHGGAEVDLIFEAGGRRYGVEARFSEAPRVTRSMRITLDTLALDHLWVLYPGATTYRAAEEITVLSIHDVAQLAAAQSP